MKRLSHRAALTALLGLAAPAFAGCFEISHGDTKTAENIVKVEPKVVPRNAFMAKVVLEGPKLTVSARQSCSLVEMQEVEHQSSTEKKFESGVAGGLIAMGALGSIPLTGGIIMLADAPKVFSSSHDSRTYNPSGKGAAIAVGTLLTVVGTVSISVPIVNAGRVAGRETTTTTERREGKTLRSGVACEGTPPTSVAVTAQAPGLAASLGQTDQQGNLTVDLKVALASWFQQPVPPVSAGIYVNNQFVSEVNVAELARLIHAEREQQDDLTFSQAEPQACASQKNEAACAKIRAYVASFPAGKHIEEAQRLIGAFTPQAPVVAVSTVADTLARAVAAAQAAENVAANKVREKAQKDQQKALLKSEEDAAKAGKAACEATCRKECEGDKKTPLRPAESTECRTTCIEEVCP